MMRFSPNLLLPCLVLAVPFSLSSCGEKKKATVTTGPAPVIADVLLENRVGNGPGELLASRADSPVRWQQWEPSIIENATKARRMIFIICGSTQYPGCVELLDAIDSSPEMVKRLNNEFIPVLADVNVARELGLGAAVLSSESRQQISFPFLLALSPEGSEVYWQPMNYRPGQDLLSLAKDGTEMISRVWKDDPDYVSRDSSLKLEARKERFPSAGDSTSTEERDKLLALAARNTTSRYDQDVGSISGTGGLLPLGLLQYLATCSGDPLLPPDTAAAARTAALGFADTVLKSGMVDMLDGGVYSTRMRNGWDLVIPVRTSFTQARTARALVGFYHGTGYEYALEVARGAVTFAEDQFIAADGLFSITRKAAPAPGNEWLWNMEQIEAVLSPEEEALWKRRCDLSGIGNIALESDPMRDFFRMNTLTPKWSLEEAAVQAKIPAERAAEIYESGRRKLLAARTGRVAQPPAAAHGMAAPSFRMVSAYAALYTATGEEVWREKAKDLATRARQTFVRGNLLIEQAAPAPETASDARAFTYALAIQAALDLADVTLEETWRLWAGDLASSLAEKFSDKEGRLLEARPESSPSQLPLQDRVMLYDDSTAGLMLTNAARLESMNQPPPPELAPLVRSLPAMAEAPIVFTDMLLAATFNRGRVTVELPTDASPAWREAATRLPLDRVSRRMGSVASAVVRRGTGPEVQPESPEALGAATAPAAP